MLACLGDLVEDVVVHLAEPVNVASDTPARIERRRGGSAANTASTAARRGVPSRFLGRVGDDAIGAALIAELAADGVDVTHVRRGGATGTIVALVDRSGERSMLTDRRACLDLTEPDPAWLEGATVLHVPFYSLADGPIAATATTVIAWAHEREVAVSIDVSSVAVIRAIGVGEVRRRLAALRPALVLANADEARVLGIESALGDAITVVKRGPDPAAVHVPASSTVEVPAPALDRAVDTTGAGDAFTAGFLGSSGWRRDPVDACAAGHRAAGELLRSR